MNIVGFLFGFGCSGYLCKFAMSSSKKKWKTKQWEHGDFLCDDDVDNDIDYGMMMREKKAQQHKL